MVTLLTLGYAAKEADLALARVMADPSLLLVDIRYRPVSRYRPAFRREALARQYPDRYHHVQALGNVNYADRTLPIVLLDAPVGLAVVASWLEGGHALCLLCACAHVEQCHRLTVARLVQERFPCEIVHL